MGECGIAARPASFVSSYFSLCSLLQAEEMSFHRVCGVAELALDCQLAASWLSASHCLERTQKTNSERELLGSEVTEAERLLWRVVLSVTGQTLPARFPGVRRQPGLQAPHQRLSCLQSSDGPGVWDQGWSGGGRPAACATDSTFLQCVWEPELLPSV